jgi:hypothetical protein
MRFIKCHFAIPERFRGVRVLSWRNIGGHMATASFAGIRGDFEVPDWWLDRQLRDRQ